MCVVLNRSLKRTERVPPGGGGTSILFPSTPTTIILAHISLNFVVNTMQY